MQDKVFFLKLVLLWDHLKFTYEVPNQISLNQTMQSQTKTYFTKLSC